MNRCSLRSPASGFDHSALYDPAFFTRAPASGSLPLRLRYRLPGACRVLRSCTDEFPISNPSPCAVH
jgi:hypothetical protein